MALDESESVSFLMSKYLCLEAGTERYLLERYRPLFTCKLTKGEKRDATRETTQEGRARGEG